jgi:hypothetical protein
MNLRRKLKIVKKIIISLILLRKIRIVRMKGMLCTINQDLTISNSH